MYVWQFWHTDPTHRKCVILTHMHYKYTSIYNMYVTVYCFILLQNIFIIYFAILFWYFWCQLHGFQEKKWRQNQFKFVKRYFFIQCWLRRFNRVHLTPTWSVITLLESRELEEQNSNYYWDLKRNFMNIFTNGLKNINF